MDDLFVLLFLISFISLFVFLIKPSILLKWFKQDWSRKKISQVFSALSLLFFILIGVFTPEVEHRETPIINNAEILQNGRETITNTTEANLESQQKELFLVTRVVDGDTIELENGEQVRYIGIDTPEVGYCYSNEAAKKNKDLVLNKKVELEEDVSETDRYDRLLRYVYIDGKFVNEILVSEGYAFAKSYPPDTKYQYKFNQAQLEAKDQELGLWGDVCDSTPTPTRQPIPTSTPKPIYIPTPTPTNIIVPVQNTQSSGGSYGCSCSKTCSQMSSCDEAYYQLNTCGCSQRDGDDDGVPCEEICPGG